MSEGHRQVPNVGDGDGSGACQREFTVGGRVSELKSGGGERGGTDDDVGIDRHIE